MNTPAERASVLVERITRAIGKRRAVAVAASQDWRGNTPTGEHWQWVCSQCDIVVEITDVVLLDGYLQCPTDGCHYYIGSLRSRETYGDDKRPLPHFVLPGVDEVTPTVALHIQLHDPATVLRHCDRDLKMLSRHRSYAIPEGYPGAGTQNCNWCNGLEWPCAEIADLAEAYEVEAP